MRKIIFFQSLIILILVWLVAIYGKDEFHQKKDDETIDIRQSRVVGNKIWISSESQKSVGIVVKPPTAIAFQEQKKFHGVLADINELIESNKLFRLNNSRLIESKIILKQKKQDLKRMQGLFDAGKKVSERQLELTELSFQAAKRKLSEIQSEMDAIRQKITSNWNSKISNGLGKEYGLLYEIISRKADLTRFSILSSSEIKRFLWEVTSSGSSNSEKYNAILLGPSGLSLQGETGETWLLRSSLLNLSSNSPVVIYATEKKKQSGFLIPNEAVVRFAGESWIYIQNSSNFFERYLIETTFSNSSGIFSENIKPEQLIVIIGAQTLLSEELRHQIKNENED